jgi:hypothetical protein
VNGDDFDLFGKMENAEPERGVKPDTFLYKVFSFSLAFSSAVSLKVSKNG